MLPIWKFLLVTFLSNLVTCCRMSQTSAAAIDDQTTKGNYEQKCAYFQKKCVPACMNNGICIKDVCYCPPGCTGTRCQTCDDVSEIKCYQSGKPDTFKEWRREALSIMGGKITSHVLKNCRSKEDRCVKTTFEAQENWAGTKIGDYQAGQTYVQTNCIGALSRGPGARWNADQPLNYDRPDGCYPIFQKLISRQNSSYIPHTKSKLIGETCICSTHGCNSVHGVNNWEEKYIE